MKLSDSEKDRGFKETYKVSCVKAEEFCVTVLQNLTREWMMRRGAADPSWKEEKA